MSPGPYLDRWDPITEFDELAPCIRCARLIEVDQLDDLGRCATSAPIEEARATRPRCDGCGIVCDHLTGLCDNCRHVIDGDEWPFERRRR